jgi:RND family efflux transporter MFP subunit
MHKWIIAIVILAAGGGGYQAWRKWKSNPDLDPLAQRPTTAVIETRNIRFSVKAAGDIGPAEQVSVRPEVNGKIEKLLVDIGDGAKEGDLLFTLDDRDLQIEKESREKEIERAKLELDQAERNYRRSQELFNEKLISQEVHEETKTRFELAKNSLDRSVKQLDMVNDRLRKTQIKAPFDCTILTRPVSVGQAVSGSGGFNSGTEVLTIANLNEMVINAHVNQADVTRLRVDQEVEVSVEAVPGLVVTGKVERVAPQATIKNNIKGFAARILLKDVDKRIRPGMTANVQIPVASAENVVSVPLAAVFTEQNPETQRSERFVYVVNGQTKERRPVEIGVADEFYAEVLSGLSDGETVALELTREELAKLSKSQATNLLAGPGSPRPGVGPSAGPPVRPPTVSTGSVGRAVGTTGSTAPRPATSSR